MPKVIRERDLRKVARRANARYLSGKVKQDTRHRSVRENFDEGRSVVDDLASSILRNRGCLNSFCGGIGRGYDLARWNQFANMPSSRDQNPKTNSQIWSNFEIAKTCQTITRESNSVSSAFSTQDSTKAVVEKIAGEMGLSGSVGNKKAMVGGSVHAAGGLSHDHGEETQSVNYELSISGFEIALNINNCVIPGGAQPLLKKEFVISFLDCGLGIASGGTEKCRWNDDGILENCVNSDVLGYLPGYPYNSINALGAPTDLHEDTDGVWDACKHFIDTHGTHIMTKTNFAGGMKISAMTNNNEEIHTNYAYAAMCAELTANPQPDASRRISATNDEGGAVTLPPVLEQVVDEANTQRADRDRPNTQQSAQRTNADASGCGKGRDCPTPDQWCDNGTCVECSTCGEGQREVSTCLGGTDRICDEGFLRIKERFDEGGGQQTMVAAQSDLASRGPNSAGGCASGTYDGSSNAIIHNGEAKVILHGGSAETRDRVTTAINGVKSATDIGMYVLTNPDVLEAVTEWMRSMKVDPWQEDFDPSTADEYAWTFKEIEDWAVDWIAQDLTNNALSNNGKLTEEYGRYAGLTFSGLNGEDEVGYILNQAQSNLQGYIVNYVNNCGFESENGAVSSVAMVPMLNVPPYYLGYTPIPGRPKFGGGRTYACRSIDMDAMHLEADAAGVDYYINQDAIRCQFPDGSHGSYAPSFTNPERGCRANWTNTADSTSYRENLHPTTWPLNWLESNEGKLYYQLEADSHDPEYFEEGPLGDDLKYKKKPSQWRQFSINTVQPSGPWKAANKICAYKDTAWSSNLQKKCYNGWDPNVPDDPNTRFVPSAAAGEKPKIVYLDRLKPYVKYS